MNVIMTVINPAGVSSEIGVEPQHLEIIQLLDMTAKEEDFCFLMTDGEWEDYDKTVVNRACDLGLVTIHSPGGGWSYMTGWRLTKLGKRVAGVPVKTGFLARLIAHFST